MGNTGSTGAAGKGISSITEYYLASASASGVTTGTSGWTTTIQTISTSKKYLWNYEIIKYTDGSSTTTTPCIIGVYGNTGATGATGPQGPAGEAFTIAKTYASISAMNSGYASDGVKVGQFVMIDTGNVNDADNAKLYVKGSSAYTYITDLSGATGMTGPQGAKGATGATGPQGSKR